VYDFKFMLQRLFDFLHTDAPVLTSPFEVHRPFHQLSLAFLKFTYFNRIQRNVCECILLLESKKRGRPLFG